MKRFLLNRFVVSSFLAFCMFAGYAVADDSSKNKSGGLKGLKLSLPKPGSAKAADQDVDASADSIGFIGSNIIAKGNVYIKYNDFQIKANEAIVNISTKDIEAIGNITFIKVTGTESTVTLSELQQLRAKSDCRVQIDSYTTDALGVQKLKVTTFTDQLTYHGEKIVGNLNSGTMEFKAFKCKADAYYCSGEYATRNHDGLIVIKNVKLTTCDYEEDGHEHYAIKAGTVKIFPPSDAPKDLFKYNPDMGDHSMWAYNCTVEAEGVPVGWLPVMYKPADENLGLFQVRGGHDSDWGYFVLVSKKFHLLDYPNTTTKLMLDVYSGRGVAIGNQTEIRTETAATNLFLYGLRDQHPYGYSNKGDAEKELDATRRLTVPKNRYDLRLDNVTHITPRLDFRGQIEKLSDVNMLKDYFNDRYQTDPQPATYGALEYQFDRFSTGLLVKPKINDFNSEVQRLPEFMLEVPRQELWKNIYYQSQNSADYFMMSWRSYDRAQDAGVGNGVDPSNYNSGRFDSLHMFYYPVAIDWLNLIPRAGFRLTGFSKTSRNDITNADLGSMFSADYVDATTTSPDVDVTNYDASGGAKLRYLGEVGLEANTKIYRSWQNAKNAFWELDGLRHVMTPYANYTLLSNPNVNNNRILYYDDIDRIERQNFVRLGLQHNLQTRRGTYGAEQIYNWMSLENYIDYHFVNEKGYKQLGDLGTKYTFSPTDKLTLSSLLLLDTGQSNDHDVETYRVDHYTGDRKGIGNKWIDKWENTVSYKIMQDMKVYGTYNYQDAYSSRSAYSMGSTLTEIDSTSSFLKTYTSRSQTFTAGYEFPIPVDDKTFGAAEVNYDVEEGSIRELKGKIKRKIHCWELAVEGTQSMERDYLLSKKYKNSIMFTASLVAIPSAKLSQRKNSSSGGDSGGSN